MSNIEGMPAQPLVSIDAVPLILHRSELHLVLGVRQSDPFAGRAALPGVLLLAHERLAAAVERSLLTKIGVAAESILTDLEIGVFDDFERDERGPTLSVAHLVILDPETSLADARIRLVPLAGVTELPFDHAAMIARAAAVLLDALWVNAEATRALLGPSFDTASLIARMKELAAAAGRPAPETGNLGRALSANKALNRATSSATAVGRGRPPAIWEWV